MARKSVSVAQPKNIDDAVLVFERMLQRNDGSLPAVPASTIYMTLGALVGVSVPAVSGGSAGTPPPAPPGTHKISEDIAVPMRALYPSLKRNYLDYLAVKSLFATTTNGLQTQLGFADGQMVSTAATARSYINRAIKGLLGVFAGNENELETYGLQVTVSSGSSGGGGTPTP